MSAAGNVYHFEIEQGEAGRLNDLAVVKKCIRTIVEKAHFQVLGELDHLFTPQGVSAVLLLAESHIAVHTWPEHGTAYVTFTTCRTCDQDFIDQAARIIAESFQAERVEPRGLDA